MTAPVEIRFQDIDLSGLIALPGRIGVIMSPEGRLSAAARRLDSRMGGALRRLAASQAWEKTKDGDGQEIAFASRIAAERVLVLRLDARAPTDVLRKAGAALARFHDAGQPLHVIAPDRLAPELAYGLALRAYAFTAHKTDPKTDPQPVTFHVPGAQAVARASADNAALVEGVFFARDLVNEPSNILTTTDFAARLAAMQDLGLDVEILDEDVLASLGMRTLLAVGQGSDSPSRVVIMRWNGGGDAAPLALVGKGVVFDSGGISIKPAGGMQDMTMDMGGAGVVAGVMRALALRRARANVVGIVGLVENMPDGRAQRPGDVVRSMKGDTIEVINTDAEGRLVLADVLWYAQERFKPAAMINLATLTGAIIVGLGHENAGVFSNDDALCDAFLAAARTEGEGAWRMPLSESYDKALKSRIADMKNVGGRAGGAIIAAQFLQRFVRKEVSWVHLDIAGVTLLEHDTPLAPKGATGWGVRALDRLVRSRFEV